MATVANICNLALRSLGAPKINAITDDTDNARVLNDIYTMLRDEVICAHPWNFAIKRATLTALGGAVATWAAEGTANVWRASQTTEPASVLFDGTEGTEKTSIAALTAARYWYWLSNVLYVYSTSDPDTAYTTITAVIPEYEYNQAYSLPSDCLRLIRLEDDDAEFVREGTLILTDKDECKIQYIAQITDTTKFTSAFITAFAARLAAEIAIPVTNSPQIATAMMKIYEEKLRLAKGVDAQEGSSSEINIKSWEESRE